MGENLSCCSNGGQAQSRADSAAKHLQVKAGPDLKLEKTMKTLLETIS